jgi:hypothetical protein
MSFPALAPSRRTFTPGEYPHTAFRSLNGFEGRVRHSSVMIGSSLRLTYVGLPEQDMLDILLHYQDTQGIYLNFSLPADTLSGLTAADYTLTGFSWRYAAPPTVLDLPCDRYTVEVELESVESKAALISVGLRGRIGLGLVGGTVAVANGINAEIGLALNAGGAGGTGITESISFAFADNGAVGGSGSAGLDETISLELTGGGAAAANGSNNLIAVDLIPGVATIEEAFDYLDPNNIGLAVEGGFFAGLISHTQNGVATHALIVAPRATGASGTGYSLSTDYQWKTSNTFTSGADSLFNGVANTAAIVTAGISDHPAAKFCTDLTIGGYSDWYLPSQLELDIAYFELKPTTDSNSTDHGTNAYSVPKRTVNFTGGNPARTSVVDFQSGGSEAFATNIHWASHNTGAFGTNTADTINLQFGNKSNSSKTDSLRVRAFRRITL